MRYKKAIEKMCGVFCKKTKNPLSVTLMDMPNPLYKQKERANRHVNTEMLSLFLSLTEAAVIQRRNLYLVKINCLNHSD